MEFGSTLFFFLFFSNFLTCQRTQKGYLSGAIVDRNSWNTDYVYSETQRSSFSIRMRGGTCNLHWLMKSALYYVEAHGLSNIPQEKDGTQRRITRNPLIYTDYAYPVGLNFQIVAHLCLFFKWCKVLVLQK